MSPLVAVGPCACCCCYCRCCRRRCCCYCCCCGWCSMLLLLLRCSMHLLLLLLHGAAGPCCCYCCFSMLLVLLLHAAAAACKLLAHQWQAHNSPAALWAPHPRHPTPCPHPLLHSTSFAMLSVQLAQSAAAGAPRARIVCSTEDARGGGFTLAMHSGVRVRDGGMHCNWLAAIAAGRVSAASIAG